MSQVTTLQTLWRTFWRALHAERQFLQRHPWDLATVVWLPLLAILLVWWIFSQATITDLPIGVVTTENNTATATLMQAVDASPEVAIRGVYPSIQAAQQDILARVIYGVMVLPPDFEGTLKSSQPAPVLLQVNAQYGTHSGIVQKGVQSAIGTLSAAIEIKGLTARGLSDEQARIAYSPIGVQRITLFNPATNYQMFLASTVIPALLHILAMVSGAVLIGREVRDRQLGEWYAGITAQANVTPSTSSSLQLPPASRRPWMTLTCGLLGKYCLPMLAYVLWAAVGVALISTAHPVDLASLLLTHASLVLLLMLSFWLGAIFTLASFSLRIGLSITGFISAPSYAFSGVIFPYIALSDGAKMWSDMLPLTHYLKLHIDQMQAAAPTAFSLPLFYGLFLATLISGLLTVALSKRALAHPERWGKR